MSKIQPYDIPRNLKEKVDQPDGMLRLIDGRIIDCYERKGESTVPANTQLFTDNAFLLLANYEKILSDSRMFLAPISLYEQSLSVMQRPTIGIFIEWWLICNATVLFVNSTKPALLWKLTGSLFSGSNKCTYVDIDGNTNYRFVSDFSNVRGHYIHINLRYQAAKDLYSAYSLDEVIDKIKASADHKPVEYIGDELMKGRHILSN